MTSSKEDKKPTEQLLKDLNELKKQKKTMENLLRQWMKEGRSNIKRVY